MIKYNQFLLLTDANLSQKPVLIFLCKFFCYCFIFCRQSIAAKAKAALKGAVSTVM